MTRTNSQFTCLCCGGCCGPVACNPDEWAKIVQYIRENGLLPRETDGIACMLLGADKRCMAYSVRPTLCRLHGKVFKMRCPNNPQAKMMSFRDEAMASAHLPKLDEAVWLQDPESYTNAGIATEDVCPPLW